MAFINLADIVNSETGKTYRQENLEKTLKIHQFKHQKLTTT